MWPFLKKKSKTDNWISHWFSFELAPLTNHWTNPHTLPTVWHLLYCVHIFRAGLANPEAFGAKHLKEDSSSHPSVYFIPVGFFTGTTKVQQPGAAAQSQRRVLYLRSRILSKHWPLIPSGSFPEHIECVPLLGNETLLSSQKWALNQIH